MSYRGILLVACCFVGSASAATLNVPANYSTIQAAIDAANNGDTVLVASGTYHEQFDFEGKAITVKSTESGFAILDGTDLRSLLGSTTAKVTPRFCKASR